MSNESLFNQINDRAIAKRILLSCHLDLTYHCNINCVHCYVKEESRDELKTSEIKDAIDQLVALDTLFLILSGGEVLTRKDFFEIAEYARKLNFALRIMTNGMLVDEKVADKIAALNPDLISLSIYSTNPKIHDGITGVPGSLEKTINAAELLRERNLKIRITTVIMKQNRNDYPQVHELAQRLGAEFKVDLKVTPKLDGDKSPLQFQLGLDELYGVLADPLLELTVDKPIEPHLKRFANDIPCSASHSFLYISPYGDVSPCVQFNVPCGNIREKSLEEIWYHSPQMLEISSLRMSKLPVCSQCELRDNCRYCPGLSYIEEGDIMTPARSTCQEAVLLNQIRGEKDG
jgi:AdoMet-dependent heme synthase